MTARTELEKVLELAKRIEAERFLAEAMRGVENPYAQGRLDELDWTMKQIQELWPEPPDHLERIRAITDDVIGKFGTMSDKDYGRYLLDQMKEIRALSAAGGS